jgi:hypothetical protein
MWHHPNIQAKFLKFCKPTREDYCVLRTDHRVAVRKCGRVSEECRRVQKIIRIGLGFNLCVAPSYYTNVLFWTERELGN